MKILAIETATEVCSAALVLESGNIVTRFEHAPREHTKLILPMMDDVLNEGGLKIKDLDAIAFSRGPGAFTGLRIATGIAQGVALSHDLPVVAVSTLAALALSAVDTNQVAEDDLIIAALDARMGEIYWGAFVFKDGTIKEIEEESVTKPDVFSAMVANYLKAIDDKSTIHAIGSGWDAYEAEIFETIESTKIEYIKHAFPSAEFIAKLAIPMLKNGETVPPEQAQPIYIRNKVAEKSKKKPA